MKGLQAELQWIQTTLSAHGDRRCHPGQVAEQPRNCILSWEPQSGELSDFVHTRTHAHAHTDMCAQTHTRLCKHTHFTLARQAQRGAPPPPLPPRGLPSWGTKGLSAPETRCQGPGPAPMATGQVRPEPPQMFEAYGTRGLGRSSSALRFQCETTVHTWVWPRAEHT